MKLHQMTAFIQELLTATTQRQREMFCFYSVCDTGDSQKIRILSTGVETFWLLVQMLYLCATGDPWELRPLNQVHVTNLLHTVRTEMLIGCIFAVLAACRTFVT